MPIYFKKKDLRRFKYIQYNYLCLSLESKLPRAGIFVCIDLYDIPNTRILPSI